MITDDVALKIIAGSVSEVCANQVEEKLVMDLQKSLTSLNGKSERHISCSITYRQKDNAVDVKFGLRFYKNEVDSMLIKHFVDLIRKSPIVFRPFANQPQPN